MLVLSGGTALAFGINALSFVASAGCLLAIRNVPPPVSAAPITKENIVREMREGLAVVFADPWLWVGILMGTILFAINQGLFGVALPFLVKDDLGLDIGSLSFVQSMAAVGGVIAAVVLGRRQRMPRRGLVIYGSIFVAAICIIGVGVSTTIYAIGAIAVIRMAALITSGLVWTEALQSEVPSDKMGRVTSIEGVASMTVMPLGYFIVGWATDHFRAPGIFVIGGAGLAALTLVALLLKRIRRFD